MNAVCGNCGRNLYDHYYLDKTDDESKSFILQENQRLKSESLAIELLAREERYAAEVAAYESNQTLGDRIERFFSSGLFLFLAYGLFTSFILFSVIWIKNTTLEERLPYINWYFGPSGLKETIRSWFDESSAYVLSDSGFSISISIFFILNVFLVNRLISKMGWSNGARYFVISLSIASLIFNSRVEGIALACSITIVLCLSISYINSLIRSDKAKIAAAAIAEEEERERYRNSPEGKAAAIREEKEFAREKLLEDLEDISGVSNKIARTLLDQFPTIESIENASVQQLTDIPGVGKNIATAIKARLG